jgi:hypothetical protein
MKIEEGQVYTIKLNSGEELITKVTGVDTEHNQLIISEPVSVAPGPQGMGLVPSVFTANPKSEYRLNTSSVALYALTDDTVKDKYTEATTGIQLPEKKLVLG